MATKLMERQAQAQVIYMNLLVKIAQKQAEQNKDRLAFDPQGRVLVEINLDKKQMSALMTEINAATNATFDVSKSGLEAAIGKNISSITTVSVDINKNEVLKAKFHEQLKIALYKRTPKNADKIITEINKQSNGSIIALQQEFHFHLALVSRLYQTIAPDLDKNRMEKAHQATMIEVNGLVMDAYAKSLQNAINDNGTLNSAKLNKSLNKARQEILPRAHTLMMQQIIKHTGVMFNKKELQPTNEEHSLKKLAERTTATDNDILHIDTDLHLATLITGSKTTGHHRTEGKEFAHRQLISHSLNESGVIEVNKNSRIQIRTNTPTVNKGLKDENAYIEDVLLKLETVTEEYHLQDCLNGNDKKPRTFIYNSYTTNHRISDWGGNLQSQSAIHILKGAHHYNVKQLLTNPDNYVFCFVQNISVNGFGNTLSYNTSNKLRKESTLMAEMALLHTLYPTVSAEQKNTIEGVFNKYQGYLERSPQRESWFSISREGGIVKELIQSLKAEWKQSPELIASDDVLHNAQIGLKNLMAHELHFKKKYAKLFQALSVFSEEASIGGCKNGNELTQSINGRIAILDSLLNTKSLSHEQKNISRLLKKLASGGSEVKSTIEDLKTALDKEYNRTGLQSAASLVSLADQGASAKMESKSDWINSSTNQTEEKSSVMTNLHQSKARSMQAHKDLTKMMQNAWEGHPKNVWERMTSTPLGTVGAVISIFPLLIGTAIAAVIGFYGIYDNHRRATKTAKANCILQKKSGLNPINEVHTDSNSKILVSLSSNKSHKQANSAPDFSSIIGNMQTTVPKNKITKVPDSHVPDAKSSLKI